jgi:hypothetical protein
VEGRLVDPQAVVVAQEADADQRADAGVELAGGAVAVRGNRLQLDPARSFGSGPGACSGFTA